MVFHLCACGPDGPEQPPIPEGFCGEVLSVDAEVVDGEVIAEIFEGVRRELYPELDDVTIELTELESDTDFFVANFDFLTISDPPRERVYAVRYNPLLFADPPSYAAVAGILSHEVKHILDYTQMDYDEFNEFIAWYATSDVAEYERETDLYALELGCGLALRAYRIWLYEHIPPEEVEEKRRVYYTPEEIDAWLAAWLAEERR